MTGSNKSVRALFAALMTTLLAVLMHVGAGGTTSFVGIVIVFVFALWAAMILAGRRLGYLALGSLLGLGQILMHLSMGWFTAAPASTGATTTGTAMGHQHMNHGTGALDLGQAGSMSHPMSHMAGDGSSASLAMVLAHIAAVIVTAVALKRGEDIILTILQLAVGPVATALRSLAEAVGVLAEFPTRLVQGEFHLPQAITSAVVGPNYRRGPPALV
ncbi:hypothetical protein PGC08_18215 [Brevibacterium sp. BDJS002]|uniref:hypothetical protein n=1 Tax=Brevibacterium sp. BDJS002 TaxID=3020906 RepID=UPI002307A301|nr:hypothetical protein [Brevibacterium sp. BDJS002]MDN5737194.1 hypothetical protein [Brevibacterium aurantiacum]MDN5772331.1 hypothetical protein [Brevibacterium aurantiacum]WCE39908.1 hypothetical protein PGC08_18215 [Brevibacterium sp. BDJS002]